MARVGRGLVQVWTDAHMNAAGFQTVGGPYMAGQATATSCSFIDTLCTASRQKAALRTASLFLLTFVLNLNCGLALRQY